MKTKKRPDLARIYRKAAERHADYPATSPEFTCRSLQRAQELPINERSEARRRYECLFGVVEKTFSGNLRTRLGVPRSLRRLRSVQLTALCLAAAIADAGDLPDEIQEAP